MIEREIDLARYGKESMSDTPIRTEIRAPFEHTDTLSAHPALELLHDLAPQVSRITIPSEDICSIACDAVRDVCDMTIARIP